jgi:RND family efflux transporter MFP subunit
VGAGAFALRPVHVTTTDVVRGTAVDAVYATGTIEPLERLTIRAKVAGAIERFTLHEGDAVKDGDLLARVDSPSLHHDLARGEADHWAAAQQATADAPEVEALRAQVRATEAELANARAELARSMRLQTSGTTFEADVERWRARVAHLEAERAAQEARQGSLRIELTARSRGPAAVASSLAARVGDGDVRSPLTGIVLARYVEPGEVVAPNQPLFRVGTADKLRLECAVDEADIGRVVPGRTVAISLYAFADTVFHGRVTEILPDADRARKTFLVKIHLDDPPIGLRSGMSAEANIVIDEHANAVLAPASAIDARGEVWVVTGGRAERRVVRVGIRDLLRVEVLEGLREGDQVVTAGAAALSPGARVSATLLKANPTDPIPHKTGGGS